MDSELTVRAWIRLEPLIDRLRELEDAEEPDRPKVWEKIEATHLDIMTLKLFLHVRGSDLEIEREKALFEGAVMKYMGDAIQQRGWRYYVARDGNNTEHLSEGHECIMPSAGVWDENNEKIDEHSTAITEAEALLTVYIAALRNRITNKAAINGRTNLVMGSVDTTSFE
ncbi:MAG: hypothetical protein LUQ22_06155 [Methanotrichaceae archaeon]|nr:hypothetical protein [Methanotrichaceae archaeon]